VARERLKQRRTSFTPAKRARFLRVLGETGNATEAARAAGVQRMIPYNLCRRDEWFARDWDQAVSAAADRVRTREKGELGWVRRSARGTTQLATVRANMWTARDDRAFLRLLRQTGNVNASARAIGRHPDCAWRRRSTSAEFAHAFEQALADAHVRLEYGLVDYANQLIDDARDDHETQAGREGEQDCGQIVTRTDASFALQVVKWLDARKGGARRGNLSPEPSIEEVRAEVLRKVEAIQRQEERVREQEAINGPADSGGSPAGGAGLSASGQG